MRCENCTEILERIDAHTIELNRKTYTLCAACDEEIMNVIGAIESMKRHTFLFREGLYRRE